MRRLFGVILSAADAVAEAAHETSGSLHISINPRHFYIGGVNVGLSAVTGSVIVLCLVAAMLVISRKIKTFQMQPRGLQLVLETLVGAMRAFARDKVGHVADFSAPVVATFMLYILFGSLIELFGLPAVTSDINCTIPLGLMAFTLTNVVALRDLGIKQRIARLAMPMDAPMGIRAATFVIRVMTDCISPFSMALRLFANITVGAIIMELIYWKMPLVIPAVVASYFSLLHPMIQVYVFGLLSLSYMAEAIE